MRLPRALMITVILLVSIATVIPAEAVQSRPSGQSTEFGFAVPLPGGRSGQTMESFQRDIDGLARANQRWLRTGLPNWLVAPAGSPNGHVVWDAEQVKRVNTALAYARSRGLKVFLYAAGAPDWARDYRRDQYATAAKSYWAGLAQRLGHQVDVWQLFNEADMTHYRTHESVVANTTYLRELRDLIAMGRTVIKHQRSDAIVTTTLSGWPLNDEMESSWRRSLDMLAPAMDVVAVNVYTGDNLDEAGALTDRIVRLKARYGKPVYVAEFGLQTQGWSEADQAKYMSAMVRAIKAARPMAAIAYEYRDTYAGDHFQGFGLVKYDRSPKTGYSAIVQAMRSGQETRQRRG